MNSEKEKKKVSTNNKYMECHEMFSYGIQSILIVNHIIDSDCKTTWTTTLPQHKERKRLSQYVMYFLLQLEQLLANFFEQKLAKDDHSSIKYYDYNMYMFLRQ